MDYTQDSIFRIGEVIGVEGRTIYVKVDEDKNLPHLLFRGELIKNVSVGGYVMILKGFTKLVGKVESEHLKCNTKYTEDYHHPQEEIYRLLNIKLLGYFENSKYFKGVKEMPLIGNVCSLLQLHEFHKIHSFGAEDDVCLPIGHLLVDNNVPIEISISKLLTSHIGIFGNTGSGKSYTLASIFHKLFYLGESSDSFQKNAKFIVFDFNGEYSGDTTINKDKTSYKLSTYANNGDKLPIKINDILQPELLFIMASATEKTQQPFIKRALSLYEHVQTRENPRKYFIAILENLVIEVVKMTDPIKGKLLLDYLENIIPHKYDENGIDIGLLDDLSFQGNSKCFYSNGHYFNDVGNDRYIKDLTIYRQISRYEESESIIETLVEFFYIQLIKDVLNNRAVNEHIAPVINRLKNFNKDFSKIFEIVDEDSLWKGSNLVVIDMNKCNTSMKKLIPLFLCTKLYQEHKSARDKELSKTLHFIIDEAHNILSYESMRESEAWKDFRLETFEEIIKEGRKFGVYIVLASQRPSDISPTIISQLHNYLIHRLVNNRDIEMVEKAISYLDKVSVESLPILPVGACVISGVIADLPVIIQVDELAKAFRPDSDNIDLDLHWGIFDFGL